MEFVILGFLMIRDLSQYDLLKALERKVSPFYSASLGSIQAALKKLLQKEQVSASRDNNSARNRKLYHINESGKQAFVQAMLAPLSEKRLESQISSKLFFLGLLTPPQRTAVIKGAVFFLEEQLSAFNQEMADIPKKQIKPEYQDLAAFQIKTLELGIYEYQNLLVWFKGLLQELEA